jgi:hypothetical protein
LLVEVGEGAWTLACEVLKQEKVQPALWEEVEKKKSRPVIGAALLLAHRSTVLR